jgi:hypothetical protein
MIRKLSAWLLIALAATVILAGCGSSSSTSSSQSTSVAAPSSTGGASTSSSPAPAATTSTSASTPSTATPTPSTAAGVAEAVAVCKSIIQREPTLQTSVKAKVESICNKAAGGDLAGARAAAKEVCAEVINAAPIPSQAKAQALAACTKAK